RLKGAPAAIVLPPLITALRHPDESIRACAAHHLGELGPEAEPALPALAEALDAAEGKDLGLYRALARIGDPAVPVLVKAGRAATPRARLAAVIALGEAAPRAPAAVPALCEALKDSDEMVRRSAARALKRIDMETADGEQTAG